jgi:hypothetical protein
VSSPSGQPVDAIHEVVDVGETGEPEECQQHAQPANVHRRRQRRLEGVKVADAADDQQRPGNVSAKAHSIGERFEVIQPTYPGDQNGAEAVAGNQQERGRWLQQECCKPQPAEGADDDGQPATAWGG